MDNYLIATISYLFSIVLFFGLFTEMFKQDDLECTILKSVLCPIYFVFLFGELAAKIIKGLLVE